MPLLPPKNKQKNPPKHNMLKKEIYHFYGFIMCF